MVESSLSAEVLSIPKLESIQVSTQVGAKICRVLVTLQEGFFFPKALTTDFLAAREKPFGVMVTGNKQQASPLISFRLNGDDELSK